MTNSTRACVLHVGVGAVSGWIFNVWTDRSVLIIKGVCVFACVCVCVGLHVWVLHVCVCVNK